jgi:glutathione S-transferase
VKFFHSLVPLFFLSLGLFSTTNKYVSTVFSSTRIYLIDYKIFLQAVEHAKEELKTVLSVVNNHLLTHTFLVGEKITLADIVLACNLLHLYENICDETNRKPYQNLNRWFVTCVNQPHFKAVLGDFKMCQKECQVDPKKFAEFQSREVSLSI